MSSHDPAALQAYTDADNAFSIATKLWSGSPLKPTPEAFQATVATILIHMKELRRTPTAPHAPQAGHASAAAPARPAPAPAVAAVAGVPACPSCGGEMWDNRIGKKNPKSPDFKCKDKGCLDAKGMGTALWERDLKKLSPNAAAVAAQGIGSWDQVPAAIQRGQAEDSSDLPF